MKILTFSEEIKWSKPPISYNIQHQSIYVWFYLDYCLNVSLKNDFRKKNNEKYRSFKMYSLFSCKNTRFSPSVPTNTANEWWLWGKLECCDALFCLPLQHWPWWLMIWLQWLMGEDLHKMHFSLMTKLLFTFEIKVLWENRKHCILAD
jgi:hypothetical protein